MTENDDKAMSTPPDRAWPLYGAAFATALSLSICWTAMTFVLSAMGGTKAHVGYAPAANGLAYMAALLLTGSLLGHLEVKRATRAATLVALIAAAGMVVAVLAARSRPSAAPLIWIWMIIAAGGLSGAAMALYWPFLMSWVSASFEGVQLNRRFGRYNGSWSGGALIGPLIGAWLVGMNIAYPMVAAVACLAGSFLLLGLARGASPQAGAEAGPDAGPPPTHDARVLADYRWMSRIALFVSWAAFAIVRSQFALLFVDFGYSESQFGVYLTLFALCNFTALTLSGRWAFWHFRPAPLILGQLAMLTALLMVVYGRTLGVFYPSAVVLGLAFGFAYSSHLYYGASMSQKRSVRMAIHEMVISLGITIGAGTGGYLAKNVGLYAPYWFAIAMIGLGGVLQLLIHVASSRKAAPIERQAAERAETPQRPGHPI